MKITTAGLPGVRKTDGSPAYDPVRVCAQRPRLSLRAVRRDDPRTWRPEAL